MKSFKFFISFLTILCLNLVTIHKSFAQKNNIKILAPIQTYEFRLERSIVNDITFTLSYKKSYHGGKSEDVLTGHPRRTRSGESTLISGELRKYFITKQNTFNGFYLGIEGGFQKANFDLGRPHEKKGLIEANSIVTKFNFGYQKRFNNFNIELGGSTQMAFLHSDIYEILPQFEDKFFFPSYIDGFRILPTVRFGFAF